MGSYAEALKQFYDGEIASETSYSAFYEAAANADEKRKWATLLQLETETKAWLRSHRRRGTPSQICAPHPSASPAMAKLAPRRSAAKLPLSGWAPRI